MTIQTIPSELDPKKYRRFRARWTEGGTQFEVNSSIFTDDLHILSKVYVLEQFLLEIKHTAKHTRPATLKIPVDRTHAEE